MSKSGLKRVAIIAAVLVVVVTAYVALDETFNTRAKWHARFAMAGRMHEQGDDDAAVRYYCQAVEIAESRKDAADLGVTLNNLGEVYDGQGRYREAETTLKRALQLRTKALGPMNYEVAVTIRNLATVYGDVGRNRESQELLTKAMAIAEAARGPNHPMAATMLSDLGLTYLRQGSYQQADSYLRKSLEVANSTGNLRTAAATLCSMSYNYNAWGRPRDGESFARQAVREAIKLYGPAHCATLSPRLNLGNALYLEHKHDEAKKEYNDALQISIRSLGRRHPLTANLQAGLAATLVETRDYASAETLAKEAVSTLRAANGPLQSDTIAAQSSLMEIYCREGRYDAAEALHKQQICDARQLLGPMSGALAVSLEDYARFLHKIGRTSDAKQAELQARRIREERERQRLQHRDVAPSVPTG